MAYIEEEDVAVFKIHGEGWDMLCPECIMETPRKSEENWVEVLTRNDAMRENQYCVCDKCRRLIATPL